MAVQPGAVQLRAVGKRYTKYEDVPTLAYGLLRSWGRSKREQLWAVRDVSLDASPGDSIGVIGRNGSGKSTLLSMLCGVTSPTTGELQVGGRIAPLISVGVGFHPELTGRENVYVNGVILGLSRREIDRRLDAIVEFSEIESFIDTPVKFYSSGMYVRLGFSVAAHVEPDVLLIDEVLAVGDMGFQMKCFNHMNRLKQSGTTLVVVSHNMPSIEKNCDRGVVLSSGRVAFDGEVADAIEMFVQGLSAEQETVEGGKGPSLENGIVSVLSAKLCGEDDQPRSRFAAGEQMRIVVDLEAHDSVNAPFLSVAVLSEDGVCIYREHNVLQPYPSLTAGQRVSYGATCRVRLTTGVYRLAYAVGRGNRASRDPDEVARGAAFLVPPQRLTFYVTGREAAGGLADFEADFLDARTLVETEA